MSEVIEQPSTLERITALARLMLQQQANVEAAEQELAARKEAFRRTEQEDLPELMRELGVEMIKLDTGEVVSVGDDVQCGITIENRELAAKWLRDNGFGGIVKTELTIGFGRGEADAAHKLADEIEAKTGVPPGISETVHPSTLKAFVKEQREKGMSFNDSGISVHPFSRAKIKLPK